MGIVSSIIFTGLSHSQEEGIIYMGVPQWMRIQGPSWHWILPATEGMEPVTSKTVHASLKFIFNFILKSTGKTEGCLSI